MSSTWSFTRHSTSSPKSLLWRLKNDGQPATFSQFFEGLITSGELRNSFLESLGESPQAAFVWELPPLSSARLTAPFEAVTVDEPALFASRADPSAFRQHLTTRGAAVFPNLGGDAWLIAPTAERSAHASMAEPTGDADAACAHLAAFVRGCRDERAHSVLCLLGRTALMKVGADPLWISTSGLGVPWLHFRIDEQPKYYQYLPYRVG